MTGDQLKEAIVELQKMGFEITPKETAYFSKEDESKITDELNFYENTIKDRLNDLGISLDDATQLETLEIYQGEAYKGHELEALLRAVEWVYLIRTDMRSKRIGPFFRHSISLGRDLPRGITPHPYDEHQNHRIRAGKGGKKSKRKAWADALAKKFCHLTDDEIAWELIDNPDIQIEVDNICYDILVEEDPESLTKETITAIPFDPKLPKQTIRINSFMRRYIQPARKKTK